nr:glycosyl hydrolase 108 family protein [uncultured Carboxylicivirga sp.]
MQKTFDELFEGVIKHEGFYANVEGDRGGEMYMGVARNLHPTWRGWKIIDAYKAEHGKIRHNQNLNIVELYELVKVFYRHTFYHTNRIESISHGALQEIIFDWCVNSGRYGSKRVQRVLNQFYSAGLITDGIIGYKTLSAINSCEPEELFDEIKNARIRYYHQIAKKGKNYLFLEGWLKRIGEIVFEDM